VRCAGSSGSVPSSPSMGRCASAGDWKKIMVLESTSDRPGFSRLGSCPGAEPRQHYGFRRNLPASVVCADCSSLSHLLPAATAPPLPTVHQNFQSLFCPLHIPRDDLRVPRRPPSATASCQNLPLPTILALSYATHPETHLEHEAMSSHSRALHLRRSHFPLCQELRSFWRFWTRGISSRFCRRSRLI
jgi:hypothetical protein